MYQDELSREAKVFVQGWQFILEDLAAFFHRVAVALRFKR
jgi:hypothetical protein